MFKLGEMAVGDRFYAKPPGLQHVLRSGADFLVRVGWNSVRMVTADGARLDLASIYARMAPGETSEVSVFVTSGSRGKGRKPRRLFPARLIVFRQHEEAIGGFDVGSHLTWQTLGTMDYRYSPSTTLHFGYRHLQIDSRSHKL